MAFRKNKLLFFLTKGLVVLPLFFMVACSLPPTREVSMIEFQRLKLQNFFTFENSFEQILDVLNKEGEVVVPARAKNRSRDPYYVRILSTPEGPVASPYRADE